MENPNQIASSEIETLRALLRTAERRLSLFDKNGSACCGVTSAQCRTILELGEHENISIVELADALGVDKSTMSRTIDQLVHSKIAEREQDGENRRYVSVCLTRQGEGVYQELSGNMDAYLEAVWNEIPQEKRGLVLEGARELVRAVESVKCC
jgi:DNA-binding MarR family transcriptional regulator